MLNQTHLSFTQHRPPLWYEGLAKRGVTWGSWQPFSMAVSLSFSPVAQASNSLVISFPFPTHRATHMAMLIQLIVGEFDFFEGHHLLQQLLSCEWGVRVHIQPKKHRENACSLKKSHLWACVWAPPLYEIKMHISFCFRDMQWFQRHGLPESLG